MWSSGVRIAETVPALAANPDWKTTQASTFLKRGDALLELHVQAHGAGDRTHRARADAEFFDGCDGRFAQLGMGGQAEVIVGGEVDDLLPVESRFGGALRFEDAQALVSAFRAPLLELIVKIGKRGAH